MLLEGRNEKNMFEKMLFLAYLAFMYYTLSSAQQVINNNKDSEQPHGNHSNHNNAQVNKNSPPAKFDRCGHSCDTKEYQDIMQAHTEAFRMAVGVAAPAPLDLTKTKVHINIPMVFHIVDPALAPRGVAYWTAHINNNLIPILNTDYNKNYANFGATLSQSINALFANADPGKKEYYCGLTKCLPHDLNVTWNFTLDSVIINPHAGFTINGTSNENLFRSINVQSPDTKLNIIIVPSSQILGLSVFPFTDRDPSNPARIDPSLTYRNGVLIASSMFTGTTPPYNLYRTFTHEIGHWCGLLHPFDNVSVNSGDVVRYGLNHLVVDNSAGAMYGGRDQNTTGDLIADTMPQTDPTFGTIYDSFTAGYSRTFPSKRTNVRNTPYAWIFQDNNKYSNFFNFMDYTDDAQLFMFTQDQMLKMVYLMARFRPGFVTQN